MANHLPKKSRLTREITITLILKFLLIYFIWLWFFSSPVDEYLDDAQVQNAIFGASATAHPTATNRKPVEDN